MELAIPVSFFSGYENAARNRRLISFHGSSVATASSSSHLHCSSYPPSIQYLHPPSLSFKCLPNGDGSTGFSELKSPESSEDPHNGEPGSTVDKDVVGLFRNIQKRLRGRRLGEESNPRPPPNEEIESLLNHLRKLTLGHVERDTGGKRRRRRRVSPTDSSIVNSPPSDEAMGVKDLMVGMSGGGEVGKGDEVEWPPLDEACDRDGGEDGRGADESPPSDEAKPGENEGLTELGVRELRALAKQRNVKGYWAMKKATLLGLLTQSP